jgi:hypothetical protein
MPIPISMDWIGLDDGELKLISQNFIANMSNLPLNENNEHGNNMVNSFCTCSCAVVEVVVFHSQVKRTLNHRAAYNTAVAKQKR